MPLNQGQLEVTASTARFRVVVAGRRWGKTWLSIRELSRVARWPGRRVFYVAPTYRQAKQIVWDQLKARLIELNWVRRINESDLTIHLVNNSSISLRGADNPDSLRGVGLDFVCMDEFAMIDEKAWTEVLRPTLSDRNGSAMFISTPMGQSNWCYDLYQRGRDPTNSDWQSFQYTTLDGGNVSAEEVEAAQRDLDERTFRQEYLATFEMYSNRIWYAFDRAHNVRPWTKPIPPVLHIGLDFNVGQMSAIVCAQEQQNVHAIAEITLLSSNTREIVEEIQARYPGRKIWVYPDPAGAARKTSADSGVTDHTILANAGFVVKTLRQHRPVRDGINAVNTKLASASGVRTLMIDPSCRRMIESLEKHSYKQGSSIPDKDSGYDHMSDALRYYIDYVFPISREIDPYELRPQRWGHRITGAN